MSHVATIEVEITNLQDLRDAAAELGLVFSDGQQTYQWYGEHVGDFPLPDGFNIEDLGRCEHAIRLNDSDRLAARNRYGEAPYELGVVRRRDGKPGWTLLWDFFAGGFGLEEKIGPEAGLLKQSIANAATIRTMKTQGYRVASREKLPNGTVKLQFAR